MNLTTKKIKIKGMHCSSCAFRIDGDLEEIPGVQSSKTNYARALCHVELDTDTVKLEQLKAAIEKAGYQVKAIE